MAELTACVLVQDCKLEEPPQGAGYLAAISDETLGSKSLWFGLVKVAPGHRTRAHTHPHETGLYIVHGETEVHSGADLSSVAVARERDFLLIPAGVPHVAINRSTTTPVFAVVARSDPSYAEPADMRPELDALVE